MTVVNKGRGKTHSDECFKGFQKLWMFQRVSKKHMRILVCGDRNWTSYKSIYLKLKELQPTCVIQGECKGADVLGKRAARALKCPVESYPAKWHVDGIYDRTAGPKRNRQMIVEGKPDLIIAFHADLVNSKGTKGMIALANTYKIPVQHFTS